jgi:hypothetical protein
MAIKTAFKNEYIINKPDSTETLDSILHYISDNIHAWRDKNTLWDLSELDFTSIGPDEIKTFSEKVGPVTKVREGLKTAFVVDSDLTFGMIRMFQTLYNDKISIEVQVFKNQNDAIQWLTVTS